MVNMKENLKEVPLVSIVILCLNDLIYLKHLIPQLLEKTNYPNIEIIIIDNGSSDQLGLWINNNFKELKFLRYFHLPKNLGYAKGMNIGIKKAQGKYIVLCNSDILFPINWLKYMVIVAESDSNILLIGILHVQHNRRNQNLSINPKIYFHESYAVNFGCILYRKNFSEEDKIGLFDRYFHSYYEDLDLIYRIHLQGYRIIKILSSFVYHGRYLNSISKNKFESEFSSKMRARIFTRSRLYFTLKWESFILIIKEILLIKLTLIKTIFLSKDYLKLFGVLLGFFDILKDFPFIFSVRKEIKKKYPNFKSGMKRIKKMKKKTQTDLILKKEQYKRIIPLEKSIDL